MVAFGMPPTQFCGNFTHLIFPDLNGTKIAILKTYFCKTWEMVLDIQFIYLITVS
jgi:hypothetical protein